MNIPKVLRSEFPAKSGIVDFTQKLAVSLFPAIEGGNSRSWPENILTSQLIELLGPLRKRLNEDPDLLATKFMDRTGKIKGLLESDAAYISDNDPAAKQIDEVIMAYPGFYAILVYRLAHELLFLEIPVIPRVMTEHAHSLTGIDIHPGATIGSQFFIDHGTGIVIGETAIIGKRVKLYQGVTIGALSVNKGMSTKKRHPTIEDDVIIYAGSTILGGETVVGHDSIIGGNVWLTKSVQPYSLVYHLPQITVKERNSRMPS